MAARLTAYLVALIVGTTVIAGLIVGAQRDDAGPVDLIVLNGKVYTADKHGTTAEAVAVQGNKILLVGSSREVQRLRRPQTVVVDAQGGTVLPGFNDARADLVGGGLALEHVDLTGVRTFADIETAIRLWAAANADAEWVVGRGWAADVFPAGHPTRQELDAIVSDRPAILTSMDGDVAWVNTEALEIAGITRRTPNPAAGVIVKDTRTGEPTGIVKTAAIALVTKHLPPPTPQQRVAAVRAAVDAAHRFGITSVQTTGGSAEDLAAYQELRKRDDLQLRVYAGLSADTQMTPTEWRALEALRDQFPDDPLLKAGAVTVVAPDTQDSAAMPASDVWPADQPREAGAPAADEDALDRTVAELDKRGWQVIIHAAGDRAIRLALDALEWAASENPEPPRGRRHRVEADDDIDPSEAARLGSLGIVAAVAPAQGLPDTAANLAKTRGRLAFGTDWPAATLEPLLGLFAAVNRALPEAEPTAPRPDEGLSLRQAIDAYTRDAAWASFDEHRKGTLERDMLADIVILSKDIFALPASRLDEAAVSVTIFDGKIVYQRSTDTN